MNKKNACLLLGVFAVALSFCVSNLTPVFSHEDVVQSGVGGNIDDITALQTQIDARKKKIAELEQSIATFKRKIEDQKLQSVSLANQIGILESRVNEIDTDIKATQQKLEVLQLEINTNTMIINQKEQQMNRQKIMLSELVQSIHEQDGKSYLEIAANNNNFSEFYNQLHYTKAIEQELGQAVRGIRLSKEEVVSKKLELEEQHKSYIVMQNDLKQKQIDLQEQSGAKQMLLTDSKTSEFKYKTLLGNLKAQYQSTENEITGIERQVRKKLEASKKIPKSEIKESGLFTWPVPSHYITATFHDPSYPYRHVFEHSGIDLRAGQGTPVRATASGYVAQAKKCAVASCYSYVLIVHDGTVSSLYGHMSKLAVSVDQFVARGDIIGYSGGTPGTVGAGPFVTGAHLHFEIRENGIPVNAVPYLE